MSEQTPVYLDPAFNNVVIQTSPVEEQKTEGGLIVLPKSNTEQMLEGMVVAVGPGTYQDGGLLPVPFKVGQKVLFDKGLGRVIKSSGAHKTYVIQDVHIVGVVNEVT